MAFRDYREASRTNWGSERAGEGLNLEQINTGCLLRIADAVELVSRNYSDLLSQVELYKRRNREQREDIERLVKSNNALRGHFKRLKKSIEPD